MRKESKKYFFVSIFAFVAFALWTALVMTVDKAAIGPNDSEVGFASMNRFVHEFIGINMTLYAITDWLGLIPIFFMLGFSALGLFQWIKRGRIIAVDRSILLLGGFYIAVMGVYILFEYAVVNYRPVLINGYLEASYPSSTTMLVTTVMPTALLQLKERIMNKKATALISISISLFTCFMVIGRLISGVHWSSDIIAGLLISIALVFGYMAVIGEKR